jgi:hypothetical protein
MFAAFRFLLPLLLVVSLVCAASADYYTYRDGRGVVNMTNNLESVPKKFRATMKVVKEDSPPPVTRTAPATTAPEAREQAVEPAAAQPAGPFARLAEGRPWLKPLMVVGGLLALFLLVVWVTSHLSSPQLARVIYLAFFLGVFTFAYAAYARHLADGYASLKQKMVAMFIKSSEREGMSPAEKPLSTEKELLKGPVTDP